MSDLPISDSHLYEDNGLSDNPVGEKRKAYWVAGAFFVVFLGAAALIPLDSGAVGTGTVVVTGNRQAVQHRDGGVVAELHVKEGQSVKKGQILLTIAAVDIAAAERGLTAETLSLLAQKQRLYAERDTRDSGVRSTTEIVCGTPNFNGSPARGIAAKIPPDTGADQGFRAADHF